MVSQDASTDIGLVAILLITRSRPGPRLVLHVPEQSQQTVTPYQDDFDETDDSGSEPENEVRGQRAWSNGTSTAKVHISNANGHAGKPVGDSLVLGHTVDSLEKLLSPGRWCDRKKFEVNVDGLTYVGHPVYAPEDGTWSPKDQIAKEDAKATGSNRPHYGEYHMYLAPESVASTPPNPSPPHKASHDFTHIPDSMDSRTQDKLGKSMDSTTSVSSGGTPNEQMAMFHIVFVLRLRHYRDQRRVNTVYDDVIKPLSKALHYCQKQANYVSNESRRLSSLRVKAKQEQWTTQALWKHMTESCELAWALKELYDRLCANEIAVIRLNGMELSLYLGDHKQAKDGSTTQFEPTSALLLLESKEALLRQLSHPDAAVLARFVREHVPTKNLQKHANNLGIQIKDILLLAQHLVKWRKAQVISPLNQRNTYVVGPDAPLDQLPRFVDTYARSFPTLPSLPNMLKVLSGKPIKYGLLVPSRDHHGAYMEILSFLVRHKLVVQLKTYGWLKIPKDLAKRLPAPAINPNIRPMSVRSLLSPHLRPVDDDLESVSSEKTAIAAPLNKANKRLSSETQSSNQTDRPSHGDATHVLITHPAQPSKEQLQLLDALQQRLDNEELKEQFSSLLLHLDGEHPFEEIAARIGVKRVKVEEWLADLDRREWLLSVRYL